MFFYLFHLYKWVVCVTSLNIAGLVHLYLLGANKVGAWHGLFSARMNYEFKKNIYSVGLLVYLARYFPLTSELKERYIYFNTYVGDQEKG